MSRSRRPRDPNRAPAVRTLARKLAVVAASGAAGVAWGAPISFNTALPVHEGGLVWREQFIYDKNSRDRSAADRDLQVSGVVSVLGYGVTGDFALFGVLPYFHKRLEANLGSQRITRGERDIGDLSLLGRYTAYQNDAPGRTFRVAPFVGVQAPTGSNKAQDRFGRLLPGIQPGTGAWAALPGVVATHQTLAYQIDGQLSYKANRAANDIRFGDVARLDASLQYRLWPRSLGSGVPAFVYGVLEMNLVRAAKDRADGVRDSNSGGSTLFLSPGLQYVTRQWILEAGIQVPVWQRLNGTALKNDYIVNAGLRVNF